MNTNTDLHQTDISSTVVYQLLKKLHNDTDLESSTYINLALVKLCRKNNPLYSNSQAIRRVFTDVLDLLKNGTEKQEYYAFILNGRFWDEYSIARMVTSDRLDQMPQRTFSNEQKKAINVFCEVLTAQEQQCRKEHPELLNSIPIMSDMAIGIDNRVPPVIDQPSVTKDVSGARKIALLTVVGILLIVSLVLGLQIYKIKTASNQSTANTTSIPPTPALGTQAPTALPLFCQEKDVSPVVVTDPQFIRSQGLIVFDKETNPGIINNKIRSLYAAQKGIWIGYFATDQNPSSGLSYYDRETKRLLNCSQVGITDGQNVNDIVVDHNNRVWVGLEKGGVASYDGKIWRVYKTQDGLPSDWIYGLYVDDENFVWAATYKGVAKFDGNRWNTVFSVEKGTLVNDRVHVVTMDAEKNIWIGYIEDGVSVYHPTTKTWEHFSASAEGLSGNKIRNILVQTDPKTGSEAIWIATFDKGLSRYVNGTWTAFSDKNGLPSNEVHDIAVDKYSRVWAATSKGVVYFTNDQWKQYNNLDTLNLIFGINCEGKEGFCVDDENIFTGTLNLGLTQSRIPLPDDGLDVVKVCFVKEDKTEVCPDLVKDKSINTVIANYPEPLKPGSKFFMKVTVSPFKPYQLLESRGDQLINVDADTTRVYGTFPRIPVAGSIESGQDYTFFDTNNPYVIPELEGASSETLTSTWRMWMQTRLIGPNIRISFTVNSG